MAFVELAMQLLFSMKRSYREKMRFPWGLIIKPPIQHRRYIVVRLPKPDRIWMKLKQILGRKDAEVAYKIL